MRSEAIVFIGFMGAGKTSALEAARAVGLATTDGDELLEKELGMPITDFFEREGEQAFRAKEAEIIGPQLEEMVSGVTALGGGSVLSERIRKALDRHTVVWLEVGVETAWGRVSESSRPLAQDPAAFKRLHGERTPLYESLADAILPEGNRGQASQALPSIEALADLPVGTKLLWAASASGEYPVFVGRELLNSGWWPLGGRRFCITDSTVGPLYADLVEPLAVRIEVKPGESSKDIDEAVAILDKLAYTDMTRQDHVVALGGGVVGDLAGFCAHIYQRGVPVIQVPTSLVAQVDSAYGGKTGVDTAGGKNYVGAYHLPAAVLVDPDALASLSPKELAAGFVEVVKTGLLAGGELWERVRSIEVLDPDELDELVFACARYKCSIVAADERDSGVREVLNLGHTVGHAIEAESGYTRYRHGEAIGLGLLAALRLSDAPLLRDEVEEILARHDLPVALESADVEILLAHLQRDKKRTAGGVGFVLLSEPGAPRTGQILDPEVVREAVLELYP